MISKALTGLEMIMERPLGVERYLNENNTNKNNSNQPAWNHNS